jgi:hypothetical protein
MDLQKINVKVFLEKGSDFPLGDLIPVFHRWIQQDKLEGMLIDVAEYTHVHQGPGVLLIAHEGNYSVDETDGKRGFLYGQKRTQARGEQEHLKEIFRRVLKACQLMENEPETKGKLKFAPNHLQVFVNDRMAAPNNSKSHGALEEIMGPFLNWFYEGERYLLLHEKDPKKRTGFEVKVEKSFELESLLKKLNSN